MDDERAKRIRRYRQRAIEMHDKARKMTDPGMAAAYDDLAAGMETLAERLEMRARETNDYPLTQSW